VNSGALEGWAVPSWARITRSNLILYSMPRISVLNFQKDCKSIWRTHDINTQAHSRFSFWSNFIGGYWVPWYPSLTLTQWPVPNLSILFIFMRPQINFMVYTAMDLSSMPSSICEHMYNAFCATFQTLFSRCTGMANGKN
jgi:hypothetical protein